MTKKDFILVAQILRKAREVLKPNQHREVLELFAAEFARNFPRFNPEKFQRFILKD